MIGGFRPPIDEANAEGVVPWFGWEIVRGRAGAEVNSIAAFQLWLYS